MQRVYNLAVVCLLLCHVVGIDAQSCSDARGTAVCQSMINTFKKLNPFPSNPSYSYTGNKCTIAGDPYNLFRPSCCASCRAYLGGSGQAQKDSSYMNVNPTPTATCADSTSATTRCNTLAAMDSTTRASYCNSAMGTDRILCANTCGFCDSSYLASAQTTAASCIVGTTCYNSSMCNANNASIYYCSTTGGATLGTANLLNGGACSCDTCNTKLGNPCASDADCANLPYACQATVGKCACPTCVVGKPCVSDLDCGGYLGTCGYLSTKTGTIGNWFYCIASSGIGTNSEACKCQFCPNKACYSDTKACTFSTAASVCGDASFCMDKTLLTACTSASTSGDCTCQCTVGPAIGKGGDKVVTLTGKTGPVCIHGAACSGVATAKAVLGYANCGNVLANCQTAAGSACGDTTTAYADLIKANAVCYCNCLSTTNYIPNQCLGYLYATPTSTTYSTCTLNTVLVSGSAGPCGATLSEVTQLGVAGQLIMNVCAPDMSATVSSPTCKCADIYSAYSRKEGATCTADSDCEKTVYGDYASICIADTVCTGTACSKRCTAANLANEASTKTCTATTTANGCGLGKCYVVTTTSNTPDKNWLTPCLSTSTTCTCVPAGCMPNRLCGLGTTNSYNTCGGDRFACRGKCYGTTTGGTDCKMS